VGRLKPLDRLTTARLFPTRRCIRLFQWSRLDAGVPVEAHEAAAPDEEQPRSLTELLIDETTEKRRRLRKSDDENVSGVVRKPLDRLRTPRVVRRRGPSDFFSGLRRIREPRGNRLACPRTLPARPSRAPRRAAASPLHMPHCDSDGASAPVDRELARADVVPMHRTQRVRPSGASVDAVSGSQRRATAGGSRMGMEQSLGRDSRALPPAVQAEAHGTWLDAVSGATSASRVRRRSRATQQRATVERGGRSRRAGSPTVGRNGACCGRRDATVTL
jgi:hypothetical protein